MVCRFAICRTPGPAAACSRICSVTRRVRLPSTPARAPSASLAMVTDNYFSLLGLRPAFGRLILPDEGRARRDAPVLVLPHDYWQVRFRGDRSIVGRTVRLNGRPFTIIGIAPRGFNGTETLVRVLAFAPLWMVGDVS